MVSLWGSKNSGDGQENDDEENTQDEGRPRSSRQREPDERTRLLPPSHEGFLDPDDPAVSVIASGHAQSLLTTFR